MTILIRHRVNTIEVLKQTPTEYGVEIDVRSKNGKLYLHHDPFSDGPLFDDYLAEFRHAFIIVEIKEEGIERAAIEILKKRGIQNYFLLSVTLPFILGLAKDGFHETALRLSEYEDVHGPLALKGSSKWIFVDTFNKNPLTAEKYHLLKEAGYKFCYLSPERWGRPQELAQDKAYFAQHGMIIDTILTKFDHLPQWK